jgi:tyrosyl-tRNA synthetase
VNDVVVSDERAVLNPDQRTADGDIKLSFGKKTHVLLRAV